MVSALHYGNLEIEELKKTIINKGIYIRNTFYKNKISCNFLKQSNFETKIVVIDYGMGNTQSLINALNTLNYSVNLSFDTEEIFNADIVILPGVGSFPSGMEELKERNLVDALNLRVKENKPILGICLGMQLLFESSTEIKYTKGLEFLKGNVVHLNSTFNESKKIIKKIKVPNIGWNNISPF